jgi:hypothetical protein
VIEAITAQEGADPLEMTEPLYETIDPDALDSLFRDGRGSVVFEFRGFLVTVSSDGDVDLTDVNPD